VFINYEPITKLCPPKINTQLKCMEVNKCKQSFSYVTRIGRISVSFFVYKKKRFGHVQERFWKSYGRNCCFSIIYKQGQK